MRVIYRLESILACGKFEEFPTSFRQKYLWLNGTVLPYSTIIRQIGQGIIRAHTRFIQTVQDKRDNSPSQALPTGYDLSNKSHIS
jgi:hypothetical protein